ncbi:unnamed protein product [Anisakis simplex]|uniref:Secreted protein n=1 Tax=Anisakis simplex TaxID=6269 RepID=A0A0M3KAR1_ANISI|nr:unnamed protein product [Anisakis simplex]
MFLQVLILLLLAHSLNADRRSPNAILGGTVIGCVTRFGMQKCAEIVSRCDWRFRGKNDSLGKARCIKRGT